MKYKRVIFVFLLSALNIVAMEPEAADSMSENNVSFLASSIVHNRLCQHDNEFLIAELSSTAKYVLGVSRDDALAIWKLSTKEKLHTFKIDGARPHWFRFNDDDTQLAVGCADENVYIWDVVTGDCKYSLNELATFAGYSSNGVHMATGSMTGSVAVWDASTGKAVCRIPNAHAGMVSFLRYHDNDTRLASFSNMDLPLNSLKIWNTQSWEHMFTVAGYNGPVSLTYFNEAVNSFLEIIKAEFKLKELLIGFGYDVDSFRYDMRLGLLLILMPDAIQLWNLKLFNAITKQDFKDFTTHEKALLTKFASRQKLETEEQKKLIEMGFNTDYEL